MSERGFSRNHTLTAAARKLLVQDAQPLVVALLADTVCESGAFSNSPKAAGRGCSTESDAWKQIYAAQSFTIS